MKYYCDGFQSVEADDPSEAAEIFAARLARREHGRAGRVGPVNMNGFVYGGGVWDYSAFIGYKGGGGGLTGADVALSVYTKE
tara:strand:+ start:11741 stop:11986 length:246 start_codon:yes stop_codon:yes gene_type:complete